MTAPKLDFLPINPEPPKPQGINLRALLEEMVSRNASDLHIVAGVRPQLRVDGDITNSSVDHEMTAKDTLQIAYSVLTEQQKKRFELEEIGRASCRERVEMSVGGVVVVKKVRRGGGVR